LFLLIFVALRDNPPLGTIGFLSRWRQRQFSENNDLTATR